MTFEEALKKWNGGISRGAQRAFAKKISRHEVTVGHWVNGRGAPGEEIRAKAAAELGISVDDLLAMFSPPGFEGSSKFPTRYEIENKVPVLGIVCAERFNVSFGAPIESPLDVVMDKREPRFALRISGDCMEPTLHDGDFVILSESAEVKDGKVVLAFFDGEYTLKRYFRRKDHIELRPDNPRHKPIKIASNKLIIKGVAVATYRRGL